MGIYERSTDDWEGCPATLNFLTDITELRLAEEALEQSSQKWEAVISASPDGIGMISLRWENSA